MPYDTLMKEAQELPDDMIEQAVEYIRFLKYMLEKKQAEHFSDSDGMFHRTVNPLADDFISIADDFDETPECMKEYM